MRGIVQSAHKERSLSNTVAPFNLYYVFCAEYTRNLYFHDKTHGQMSKTFRMFATMKTGRVSLISI